MKEQLSAQTAALVNAKEIKETVPPKKVPDPNPEDDDEEEDDEDVSYTCSLAMLVVGVRTPSDVLCHRMRWMR